MAWGVTLEAEYADGFVHREDEADTSLYEKGRNIFYDILHKLPEQDHGRMTRFTATTEDSRYDINWTNLPENARPIYTRDMKATMMADGSSQTVECLGHNFGYQFTDENGNNHQEVREI